VSVQQQQQQQLVDVPAADVQPELDLYAAVESAGELVARSLPVLLTYPACSPIANTHISQTNIATQHTLFNTNYTHILQCK